MWELDCEESWEPKNWCFWTVVLEKTPQSPLDCKEINQSILKEIRPEYSLEGLMLKLKLQYFGHLMERTDSLEKDPDAGKDWSQKEKGTTEDEMLVWHHWLYGRKFEQALEIGDGQGGLSLSIGFALRPWVHKESDMTEWLNWAELLTL